MGFSLKKVGCDCRGQIRHRFVGGNYRRVTEGGDITLFLRCCVVIDSPSILSISRLHEKCKSIRLFDVYVAPILHSIPEMKLPDTATPKRIVLEHKTGALAGIFQINGMSNEEGIPYPLPMIVEGIHCEHDNKVCCASLVRQHRGAVYYSELIAPKELKEFDGSQR